jgi:hypothetical protein
MDRAMDPLSDFRGWIPIRVYPDSGDYWVDWLRLGAEPLRAPFFRDSIQAALRHPFHQAFRRQTPIGAMAQWRRGSPGLSPTGFIFHASRCGSTLISQLFAASAKNIVYSEPPALDALLRSLQRFPAWPQSIRTESLRALLSAWGQPVADVGTTPRKHLLIKNDGWSIFNAPLVREAWPETPWVFVYREPVEILVSQMRQRASFLIPGVVDWVATGFMVDDSFGTDQVEYCARRLGAILDAMVKHFDPANTLLINYAELPASVLTRIAPHFRIDLDADDVAALNVASSRDAKNPATSFASDGAGKQREADGHTRAMAERWMAPYYRQLEELRLRQVSRASLSQELQPALS